MSTRKQAKRSAADQRKWRQQHSSTSQDVLALLAGGDRRSTGRANQVATMAFERPALFRKLIEGMWDEDPIVRMRAADAAEKASLRKPGLLRPFKAELLGLLTDAREQELRWHLAQIIPRLPLTAKERSHAASVLQTFLEDRSSIVKTFAMQALADLALTDKRLLPGTVEMLRHCTRTGTAAMRARGRKLLARIAPP